MKKSGRGDWFSALPFLLPFFLFRFCFSSLLCHRGTNVVIEVSWKICIPGSGKGDTGVTCIHANRTIRNVGTGILNEGPDRSTTSVRRHVAPNRRFTSTKTNTSGTNLCFLCCVLTIKNTLKRKLFDFSKFALSIRVDLIEIWFLPSVLN